MRWSRLAFGILTALAIAITNDSWRVDETYIKVKDKWKYLYRSAYSEGNTLNFMLSAKKMHALHNAFSVKF